MKKYTFALIALITTLNLAAKDEFSVRLKNNKIITYPITEIDSIKEVADIGVKVYLKNNGKSVDFLSSQYTEINIPKQDKKSNKNANKVSRNAPYAWRIEYPALTHDNGNTLVITKIWNNTNRKRKEVNFSLEWDKSLKSNRWTCYYMYDGNSVTDYPVKRGNKFIEDENIPEKYRSKNSDFKGTAFDKGHLCPSADKPMDRQQNDQTFYLSNMAPQYWRHNQQLWQKMEEYVRSLNNSMFRDTLYIVKAAAIDKKNIATWEQTEIKPGMSFSNGRKATKKMNLPVSRHFYMAILCKKGNKYHAMALWVKHTNSEEYNKKRTFGDFAINIKKLEELTGIDFFCNLPDNIEKKVETEPVDLSFWGLKVTKGKKVGWEVYAPWPTDAFK